MATPADKNHPHSIYGASGASTWRNCPGAVRVVQEAKARGDIPKEKETEYSKEGTEAHDWANKVLTDQCCLEDVPKGFRTHLAGYIDHCRGVEQKALEDSLHPDLVQILNEETVPLFYRPQDRGTVDHAVVCPSFINIDDLKYGAGVKVEAEDNDQEVIYAMSLIQELEIMEGFDFPNGMPVYLTIYQPRHYSFSGEPDTWEVTVGFLREAAERIARDYEYSKHCHGEDLGDADFNNAENPSLNPSDKACLFCDAKGVCRARAKTAFGGMPSALDIENDFDFEMDTKEDLPTGKTFKMDDLMLTPGQIAWICRNGSTIKKVVDNVIDAEEKRLLAGGEIRQMKLIDGPQGNRCWVDEEKAEKVCRRILGVDESYKPRQLISAPQALTKIKAKLSELSTIAKLQFGLADEETASRSKTECLIHRPEGKPKLVPVDHPAEALDFRPVADEFDIEDDLL